MTTMTDKPLHCIRPGRTQRKRRYETAAEAMRALEEGKRTWRYPPCRWYLCPACEGYHLASEEEARTPDDIEMAREGKRRRVEGFRLEHNPFGTLDPNDYRRENRS